VPEFKILSFIVEHMESTGSTSKLVHLSIDQSFTDKLNSRFKENFTLQEIEKAADKCLAHEWLKHTALGDGKYGCIGITAKGVGVARSKERAAELKASRSWLKKTSDYIEDHKGILIFLGSLIALATFVLKITGE
jgi:hypothetical protein|tara:strand:+ start:983 stop:1387 length:405 start_codon:yes stop_codon:yes gene_type:complete